MVIESFIYGMAAILVLVPAAYWMLQWALRRFDEKIGVNFKNEVSPKITGSAIACSIYFGCRILGLAIIISAIVSRFV